MQPAAAWQPDSAAGAAPGGEAPGGQPLRISASRRYSIDSQGSGLQPGMQFASSDRAESVTSTAESAPGAAHAQYGYAPPAAAGHPPAGHPLPAQPAAAFQPPAASAAPFAPQLMAAQQAVAQPAAGVPPTPVPFGGGYGYGAAAAPPAFQPGHHAAAAPGQQQYAPTHQQYGAAIPGQQHMPPQGAGQYGGFTNVRL